MTRTLTLSDEEALATAALFMLSSEIIFQAAPSLAVSKAVAQSVGALGPQKFRDLVLKIKELTAATANLPAFTPPMPSQDS